jgi:hypothetical protein
MSESIFRGADSWSWLENVGDGRVRPRRVFRPKRAPKSEASAGREGPPCFFGASGGSDSAAAQVVLPFGNPAESDSS